MNNLNSRSFSCHLRTLALGAVGVASSLAGAEFVVQNPYPDPLAGTFALAGEALGDDAAKVRLVRSDTGAEIPSQVVDGDGRKQLIGGLSLRGYEAVSIRSETAAVAVKSGLAVREDEKQRLIIENPLYRATFLGDAGYRLGWVDDIAAGKNIVAMGWLSLIEDGEQDTYNGQGAKDRQAWHQLNAKVSAKILYAGLCENAVRLSWSYGGSDVSMVLRCNAFNRLIRHEVEMKPGPVIIQAQYTLNLPGYGQGGEATMLPQEERYPMQAMPCPGYEFFWNPERKGGVGLISAVGGNVLNTTWEMRGVGEGSGEDINRLYLFSRPFRGSATPAQPRMSFALVAGGNPQEVAAYQLPAGRTREFTAYPRRQASISPIGDALVGNAQRFSVAIDAQYAADRVTVQIGSKNVFSGAIPGNRQIEVAWTPAEEGPVDLVVAGPAGERLLDQVIRVRKEIDIQALATGKIVFRPNAPRTAKVTVRNNAGQGRAFVLRSSVISHVDQRAVVDEQKINLAPGEIRTIDVSWSKDTSEGGATVIAEALIDGRLIDSEEECYAITDVNTRVGQYAGANPGCFNVPGQEKVMIKELRNNYYTAYEYYCWTPCPFTGVVPPGDSWVPHTESQAAYVNTVSKRFVQDFVKYSHDNGLQVYPWMNGEVALPTGLDHPEHYRYSADGQPLLYNGRIWDGKRFAIAYAASPYSEKESYAWGRRMADSIDMFGWDGCRFDWAFTPSVVGDPLRAAESQWYTFDGKSSRELFKDPDASGTAFLRAFLRGVNERHPEFIYGANSSCVDENAWKMQPTYSAEISKNSWLWFENLLGYDSKPLSTWRLWAESMVAQFHRSRLLGAQAGVGWMRPYPPGTVSHKLMAYAVLFSGYKWIGPADRMESLGEGWKCWRYALRFSEYFYGGGFTAIAAPRNGGEIAVLNDKGALWKPWVFERTTGKVREVLIGVLNTDGDTHIVERRPIPAPLKDLKVRITLADGERIASSVLLAPEPTPHAVRLDPAGADGAIALPAIDWAGAVLVRIERK